MQERFINKDIDQAYIQTCLVELGNWKKSNELEKEYQRYALDLIKISGPITKAGSIPFFVGGIFENANELTEHCKDNLGPFVVQVQADRQVLKLRQLENEGKRLDILSLQAATPKETFGKFIHPRASYNLLGEDKTKLEAKKGTLTAKPVPDVSAVANAIVTQATHARLDREKTTLLAAIAALIQKAGDTLTDDQTAIDGIESEYIAVMADTRRFGGPADHGVWKARLELQQKNAEVLDKKMKAVSKEINAKIEEADIVIQDIEVNTPKT